MKITAILGSSRSPANSEQLVQHVLKDINAETIDLKDCRIEPIEDRRHVDGGFVPVDDDYEDILEKVLESDILIFGTPLYWYGMSGYMKTFFDRWSQYSRDERFDFKAKMAGKKAYVVVTGGDSPTFKALPLIQQFRYIFEFVDADFVDYIIGNGGKPGDIEGDRAALAKAGLWNETLKTKMHV
ncbi:MAG TPA: flavodoxin family protein [Bacillales bacterium]|nr:flavodoxin family protein [Bacillales bacterium]